MSEKKVIGIGNALVDMVAKLPSDDLLTSLGLPKGSMQLVDEHQSTEILKEMEILRPQLAAGGSAANTITGIAQLGGKTGYVGMIGKDHYADVFTKEMHEQGIKTNIFISDAKGTGCAATLVSVDGQRTFATYLGAAVEMTAEKLPSSLFEGYDILHIEGYLVQNHELLRSAIDMAKKEGLQISLDMANFFVVKENLSFLQELMPKIDIVFANEEEAAAYAQTEDPLQALDVLAETCPYAIVKVGKEGAYLKHEGKVLHFATTGKPCVDTTGAGDLFAAGFLAGMIEGKPLDVCGKMATILAENVIGVVGARMDSAQWDGIRQSI